MSQPFDTDLYLTSILPQAKQQRRNPDTSKRSLRCYAILKGDIT